MRLAVVVGTRPEVIKTAPVIYELKKRPHLFEVKVIATAQHREMLDQALSLFHITPDYDLDLMCPGQSLAGFTSRVMESMHTALEEIAPDMIMVQGDTTTVFVASLAAFYWKIPVVHIEAGLRSYDLKNPFPEEANRRLTSILTDIHCAPTPLAKTRLLNEGISPEKIIVTGNTVVDALHYILNRPFSFENTPLASIDLNQYRTVLVTCHRRESLEHDLENILHALLDLVKKFPDIRIIYPVHLNPGVQGPVRRMLSHIDRIHLLPPLDYVTFINLLKHSSLILTDSGGLQEEAPTLGKPLLVMRTVTERPEAFQHGLSKIIGTNRETIVQEASRVLSSDETTNAVPTGNPYGDGAASCRIVDALERWSRDKYPLLDPKCEFSYSGTSHLI
ncbi:MAG: UDP-N-acetylglucosamine 2-epimerase (non-hydrolyzing) [Nitrospirota bacterium]